MKLFVIFIPLNAVTHLFWGRTSNVLEVGELPQTPVGILNIYLLKMQNILNSKLYQAPET